MIKRLHNHLLENYPLLWNLRIINILAILAIFHIVHFLVGYSTYTDEFTSIWNSPASMYFSTTFFMFSIIGSAVIFILWLIRVLRNNAFKSFYPVSNGKLFQEFMIFFIVCLLNITCYYSYTFGYVFHARNNTNNVENEKDIAIFNKIAPILQYNKESYKIENRIYPKPFPLTKRYNDQTSDENGHSDYEYISEDGQTYSSAKVDSMVGGFEYSYLNSNFLSSLIVDENDRRNNLQSVENQVDEYKKHTQLLSNPQELKADMAAFLKLCDKHKIRYRLEIDDWYKWVYNPPYFPVNYLILQENASSYENYTTTDDAASISEATTLNPKGYFVDVPKLQQVLQSTKKVHDYGFDLGPFLAFVNAALFMAILIFTFRASSRRIWMISVIGSSLLVLIIGALTAILAIGSNKDSIMFFYLIIIASFFIVHITTTNKTFSGVTLIWFVWSLPYVSIIILGIMIKDFNENNYKSYFVYSLIIYFIILRLLLVPRFRAWQAMPEN